MNKLNFLQIIKAAGKMLFDLEPEITEVMALQITNTTYNAASEIFPVLIEAFRCQKQKFAHYFMPEHSQTGYKMAA